MDGLAYSIPHHVEQSAKHHYSFGFLYSTLAADAMRNALSACKYGFGLGLVPTITWPLIQLDC